MEARKGVETATVDHKVNWFSKARVKSVKVLGQGYNVDEVVYWQKQKDGTFLVHSGRGFTLRQLSKDQALESLQSLRDNSGSTVHVGAEVQAMLDELVRINQLLMEL